MLSAERAGSCTLIDREGERLLFDAGRGCAIRLARVRIPWRDSIVADAEFHVVRDASAPNRRLEGSGRGIRA
jgi:hypothetical protein